MQSTRESAGATHIEKDTLGPVAVPAEHLRGAQTQRALGVLKKGAALANGDVNRSRSSNDAFPVVMHSAAATETGDRRDG